MGALSREAQARAVFLAARGLTDEQIGARLGYSPAGIRWMRRRAAELAARALPPPTERAAALGRGRALVAAKLAAGEWVLPAPTEGARR